MSGPDHAQEAVLEQGRSLDPPRLQTQDGAARQIDFSAVEGDDELPVP